MGGRLAPSGIALLLLLLLRTQAYPYYFTQMYASTCTSQPTKGYKGHGSPAVSKWVLFHPSLLHS